MTPFELLLSRLDGVRETFTGWTANCPAHDDQKASLSVNEGSDGRVLVFCHAGCELASIVAKVGLTPKDLFPRNESPPRGKAKSASAKRTYASLDEAVASFGRGKPSNIWLYHDAAGQVIGAVVRWDREDGKDIRPLSRDEEGWRIGAMCEPRPLYGLPELLAARADHPVIVVEGEKATDAAKMLGFTATTSSGGAAAAAKTHWSRFAGKEAWILPDNDVAGRRYAEEVAGILSALTPPALVRIVELPGLPEKGDLVDWIDGHGDAAEPDSMRDEIETLARKCEWWRGAMQDWPEIISFDKLNVPRFPTHVLPSELRRWVEAESVATQTPPDLAGLLSLAVCSAGIARRVEVEPREGWREPVNLFVAVLLEPGNRKSAVFADAIRPLRELEAALIEHAMPEVARAQSRRRVREREAKKMEEAAASKGNRDAASRAEEIAAELAEEPEPVLPRLIIDDATAEKVGMMLADQDGRIASMSPEGGVFDLMKGMYSKSGMPQFGVYLMGHSGDDLVTDRVSRKCVRVKRPALTCAYAIQPAVIKGLAKEQAFRGRGLLARFLYAAPQSWIGDREIASPPVPHAVHCVYRETVRRLAATEGENVLQLSADAAVEFLNWESEIEAMLGDGGRMEKKRDWGAKLAGATLRIAAVLHCVEYGPKGPIEATTLSAAIEIARYLVPHAEAVLTMMAARESAVDDDACYVLRWIERHERCEFTKSEAQHHGKRRFPKADSIDPALAELERRGIIRRRPEKPAGPGRPPSPVYEVNPEVIASWSPEKRSRNSRNSAGEPLGNGYGNIGSAFEQPSVAQTEPEAASGIVDQDGEERLETLSASTEPPTELPGQNDGRNHESDSGGADSKVPRRFPFAGDDDMPSAYRHGL
jgi:hypothetical protein